MSIYRSKNTCFVGSTGKSDFQRWQLNHWNAWVVDIHILSVLLSRAAQLISTVMIVGKKRCGLCATEHPGPDSNFRCATYTMKYFMGKKSSPSVLVFYMTVELLYSHQARGFRAPFKVCGGEGWGAGIDLKPLSPTSSSSSPLRHRPLPEALASLPPP